MNYSVELDLVRSREDIKVLVDGLHAYAKQSKDLPPGEVFAFFVRDENRKVLGGCEGVIFYGCIYVDLLWIDESIRRQGYGRKLMLAAEKFGREKNCLFMTVNTMDWEGLEFYKKLGFKVEFTRRGFSKNSISYMLRKDF